METLIQIRLKNNKKPQCVLISIYLLFPLFWFVMYFVARFLGFLLFAIIVSSSDEPLFDDYHSFPNSTIFLNNNSKFLENNIQKNLLQKDINEAKININNFFTEIETIIQKEKAKNNNSEILEQSNNNISNLEQYYIDNNYLNVSNEKNINNYPNITINSKKKDKDSEKNSISTYLVLSIEFSILCCLLTRNMANEKNQKLDILFELKGISKKEDFFSWYFIYVILSIPTIIGISLTICFYNIFCSSSKISFDSIIFINLIFYITNIYFFSNFIYILFNDKKISLFIVIFLNSFSIILSFILEGINLRVINLILSIFPNINIYYYIQIIYYFSDDMPEEKSTRYKGITYYETIIIFIIQSFLFIFSFIFLKSHNKKSCFNKDNNIERNENGLNSNLIQEKENHVPLNNNHQELSVKEMQKKIENKYLKISSISKKFGDLNVINNFSLELFEDEIFCLYGLNGTGKTTLIKMILGLISPDEGDIILDGNSLLQNKNLINNNISICQQGNNLFENLTIKENLEYMYRLNGTEPNYDEIQNIINFFNLNTAENILFKNLAEESKKIVCFASSILEQKNILILDEPTVGIISDSKIKLWDLLKYNQNNKIIFVATNSLQEAEYLGNRIGILKDGNLICSGDSNFLKMKYAKNINIKILVNQDLFNENYEATISNKIKEYDINSEIKKNSNEILITMKYNKDIPQLINFIEELKNNNIIINYEIEKYSLESIFSNLKNDEDMFKNVLNFQDINV